ncbi:MAG: hypothetical protein EAZ55_11995 [Cytophagales bacterium]|nr:MAG: hypothetical protein EAZ55_11995 [Cytophagales bacterium]
MKRYTFYVFVFVLSTGLLLLQSCGNGNEKKDDANTKNNAKENKKQNDLAAKYLEVQLKGFKKEGENKWIPTDGANSKIGFVVINTQRCENCQRLQSLQGFKDEVTLAPEYKNAYGKTFNNKMVFFAEMHAKDNVETEEELGPVLIAEFMAAKDMMVSVSIFPKEEAIESDKFAKDMDTIMQVLTQF